MASFRAIITDEANNKLSIQCYCNSNFVVGSNDKKFLKTRFIQYKKTCQTFLQVTEKKLPRKRSAEVLEVEFSTVLNREESYLPSSNLSENLSLSNPGEVSFFSYSEREMKA